MKIYITSHLMLNTAWFAQIMHLSMSSPTPQVQVMSGFRWGFELEVLPEGWEI